jgi:hypothetical protein
VLGKRLRGDGVYQGGSLDPAEVAAQFAEHWRAQRQLAAGSLTFGEERLVYAPPGNSPPGNCSRAL